MQINPHTQESPSLNYWSFPQSGYITETHSIWPHVSTSKLPCPLPTISPPPSKYTHPPPKRNKYIYTYPLKSNSRKQVNGFLKMWFILLNKILASSTKEWNYRYGLTSKTVSERSQTQKTAYIWFHLSDILEKAEL